MRFAYADPPYLGQGSRHYAKQHPEAGVWDDLGAHRDLIDRLVSEFPDGWAFSASSTSLRQILSLCPEDVRIMAWVKPWASWKPTHRVQYAWEPVIVRGGRLTNLAKVPRAEKPPSVRDWVSANITMKKGLVGAKPEAFVTWLLDVLHVLPGDELVDLFPGTGIVSRVFAERTAA